MSTTPVRDRATRWRESAAREIGYPAPDDAEVVLLRTTLAGRVYKLALRLEALRLALTMLGDRQVDAILAEDAAMNEDGDDLRPSDDVAHPRDYDFTGGVRGKHASDREATDGA